MKNTLIMKNIKPVDVEKLDKKWIYHFKNKDTEVKVSVLKCYLKKFPIDASYDIYKIEFFKDPTGMTDDDKDISYYTMILAEDIK